MLDTYFVFPYSGDMTNETEKGGPIDAVVVYRTDYENLACRVLGSLARSAYADRTGFLYKEGEYQVVIMGDMEMAEMEKLGRTCRNIASFDFATLPLQSFRQFDSI